MHEHWSERIECQLKFMERKKWSREKNEWRRQEKKNEKKLRLHLISYMSTYICIKEQTNKIVEKYVEKTTTIHNDHETNREQAENIYVYGQSTHTPHHRWKFT